MAAPHTTRNIFGYLMIILQTSLLFQDSVFAQDSPYLIFTNRDTMAEGIRRTSDLDGNNVRTLVDNMTASGLDYDYRDKTLFWSSVLDKAIYKGAIDGSSRTLLTNDTQNPETIAWDWINKKLYWTDVTRGTLEVLDPATGYRKVLLDVTREARIRGIQLDPINGWVYYTTFAEQLGTIGKLSMDGTESMILHDSNIVTSPNGITLDYSTSTLYWVDASGSNNIVGKSSTELGSRNMTAFRFPSRRLPFHATYHSGRLYMTEWISSSVLRLDLDSTPELQAILPTQGRAGMIRVVAETKQQIVPNPCDGAGCSQLCLLSSRDSRGYTCACTNGVTLNQDGRTCGNVEQTPSPPTQPPSTTTAAPETTNPPVELCSSEVCRNGGTCTNINSPPYFECKCPPSYTGALCDEIRNTDPFTGNDNVLTYVLIVLGILVFLVFLLVGLLLFSYWTMKFRSKSSKHHHRRSSIDGMSTSSRDSAPQFVLVNGRLSEHDYMSIKSRGNSPAPSRILICNVGDHGAVVPNNYIIEQPQLVRPPVPNGSQTLDHMFSTRGPVPEPRPNGQLPEPIYNTVNSTKRQTL